MRWGTLRMEQFERADSLMWFWTLGAYEVVRTMCQAEACFSPELLTRLKNLKKTLADIRMPAAKMERMGKREPISSSRSPSGWSNKSKDILLFRSNPDDYLSGRAILDEFDDVFSSITKNDVLLSHEESYGRGT